MTLSETEIRELIEDAARQTGYSVDEIAADYQEYFAAAVTPERDVRAEILTSLEGCQTIGDFVLVIERYRQMAERERAQTKEAEE